MPVGYMCQGLSVAILEPSTGFTVCLLANSTLTHAEQLPHFLMLLNQALCILRGGSGWVAGCHGVPVLT